MRIAQVAPLIERVPPKLYGGTERVVSYLTEELIRQGHDVTLFASGDSETLAHLVPVSNEALRLCPTIVDPLPYHVLQLEQVLKQAGNFDLIHFHTDFLHFPATRRLATPTITTLHGRLDLPDIMPLYREFCEMPLVSISDAQRRPMSWANWRRTIHHGLPPDLLRLQPRPGSYLAFLGRICHEKRPDRAVRIAREVGIELKVAAKVDAADRDYFQRVFEPMLAGGGVDFIGEIGDNEKSAFLGEALATLFPIDWPEPFGLTVIESMACGTPVVAYRAGSVPELVVDGVTGFVVDDHRQAVAAVKRVPDLDREVIRREFEERFSVVRMASEYLELYAELIGTPRVDVGLLAVDSDWTRATAETSH